MCTSTTITSKVCLEGTCFSSSLNSFHLPPPEPYNDSAGKGKQMMIEGAKSKTALQIGYFGKTFDRIMEVYSVQ